MATAAPSGGQSTMETPWYAAYPSVKENAAAVSASEIRKWLLDTQRPRSEFVLIDLRRNDHEGGSIRGSINIPAQSLHPTMPALYSLFEAAKVKKVIWFCGSSGGRGTRAAGWFADFLREKGNSDMESLVMAGGIKGWVKSGPAYIEMMDEYDATKW